MPNALDLVGARFGLLTVLSVSRRDNLRAWLCQCDCGGTIVSITGALRSGQTSSCGCRKRSVLPESTFKHGGVKQHKRTYSCWRAMRVRCNNPNSPAYCRYGGAGVTVCPQWDDFAVFLRDMGDAPEGYSLDRIDGTKGYTPENCRWATPKQQARNMRVNRMISYGGVTACLSEWAERLGTTPSNLWKHCRRKGDAAAIEFYLPIGEVVRMI